MFKVVLHLQSLQNIVYTAHVVKYILVAYLTPNILHPYSPGYMLPHLWQPLACSLYLWVCFFFCYSSTLLYFSDSTYKWYHTVFVFLWLTSLGIMPSKTIHVAANGKKKINGIFHRTRTNHFKICMETQKTLDSQNNLEKKKKKKKRAELQESCSLTPDYIIKVE